MNTPASTEVLLQGVKDHLRRCRTAGLQQFDCVCGRSALLACVACGQVLLVETDDATVNPTGPPEMCDHAAALYAPAT